MIPYKDIGDNLTVNEFNGVISLIRDNIKFQEDIKINTSTVTGEYGEYTFDFQEATVLDNGILITNETLSTVGTVLLSNPVFPHSHYFLDLKVYSTEDIGVSGMDNADIIVTDLTIPLQIDSPVNIPFQTLDMNNIVGFNATVRVDHKDLVIRGASHINLSVSKSNPVWDETVTITARYIDEFDEPISDAEIIFYQGETSIGSVTTNEQGYASMTKSWSSVGSLSLVATCESISSNDITVNVNKRDITLSLSSDINYGVAGLDFGINGTIVDNYSGSGIDNVSLSIMNGESSVDTVTSSSGSFSKTITYPSASMSLKVKFNGNGYYNTKTSSSISIPVATDYSTFVVDATSSTSISTSNNILGSTRNKTVIVDYGDNTLVAENRFNHTYSQQGTYTIKVYNLYDIGANGFENKDWITEFNASNQFGNMGNACFRGSSITKVHLGTGIIDISEDCFYNSSLSSISFAGELRYIESRAFWGSYLETIDIPSSVVYIGDSAFGNTALEFINLFWDNSSDIVEYNYTWTLYTELAFKIPTGTTSLYLAKNYPGDKLVEEGSSYSKIVTSTDKPILSKKDGDYATLYAQLKDDSDVDVARANVLITFYRTDSNGTVIETLGTGRTDATGKATLIDGYESQGVGNVYFGSTDGSLLSETYEVEDCTYYWDCLSDDGHWNWDNAMTRSYSSNGITISKSGNSEGICSKSDIILPTDFECSFQWNGGQNYSINVNAGGGGIECQVGSKIWYYLRQCANATSNPITESTAPSSGDVFKIVRQNGQIKYYRNNVLKGTNYLSQIDYNYLELTAYSSSRTSTIKDIKIKPL